VTDFRLVRQCCNSVLTVMDDEGLAAFSASMVDLNIQQYSRVWIHTHPNMSPSPSGPDEATFRTAFGDCSWAVMFIVATNGKHYCRVRFNDGPGLQKELPVEIDWQSPCKATDTAAWLAEYLANVTWDRGTMSDLQQVINKTSYWDGAGWSGGRWAGWEDEDDLYNRTKKHEVVALPVPEPAKPATQKGKDSWVQAMDAVAAVLEEEGVDLKECEDLEGFLQVCVGMNDDEWMNVRQLLEQFRLDDLLVAEDGWCTVEEAISALWSVPEILDGLAKAELYDQEIECTGARGFKDDDDYAGWAQA